MPDISLADSYESTVSGGCFTTKKTTTTTTTCGGTAYLYGDQYKSPWNEGHDCWHVCSKCGQVVSAQPYDWWVQWYGNVSQTMTCNKTISGETKITYTCSCGKKAGQASN